jgi:predicted nuclease with TOPRIM domain
MESIYLAIKLGYNNYDEILTADVDELKTKWLALINEHKNKAIEILTTEKTNSQNEGNTDDVEEIEVILSLLNDLTTEINDEMSSLSDRESILTYWPPLLLPAPIYLSTT